MLSPKLDRVTITGADDSIVPRDLIALSERFPFVEWGILASHNNTIKNGGAIRYPGMGWIDELQRFAKKNSCLRRLSLHINGSWVRSLLLGKFDDSFPIGILPSFPRVQLNFHAEHTPCNPSLFTAALKTMPGQDFIFQLDGVKGNQHLEAANADEVPRCFGLFDASGGAGIVPFAWPKPIYLDVFPGEDGEGVEQYAYHGYAGGLGPDNLETELPKILEAASGNEFTHAGRIWIDMETRVRSDFDRQFDLGKVVRCLEIAEPFITKSGD